MKDYADKQGFHYKEIYWEDLTKETQKELAKYLDKDDIETFSTFPLVSIPYTNRRK